MKQRKRTATAICLSLGLFLCLGGCASRAPQYTQPAAPVPTAWPDGPAYKAEIAKPDEKPVAKIPWQEFFVNANDGTNEGLKHRTKPFMSCQFHPEGRSGPEDTNFLFDEFVKMLK